MKMNRGWYGESHRHKLSAMGIRNARSRADVLAAPLQSESTVLGVQFSLNVPSTIYDKKVDKQTYERRVDDVKKYLSTLFGGDTTIKAKGDYTSDGKLITEDVFIVESSTTRKDYNKHKAELEAFLKTKKTEWGQETLGFTFEDKFYIYPKNPGAEVPKPTTFKKSGVPDNRFDPKQLREGMRVEREHTDDPAVTKAIAKAHLSEDKNYYKKLKVMEK